MGRAEYLAENMEWKDALPLLLKNQKQFQTNFDVSGVQILQEVSTTTVQTVTTATITKVDAFQLMAMCSGGVVTFEAHISLSAGNLTSLWSLQVDDKTVAGPRYGINANTTGLLVFIWQGKLSPGSHSFKLFVDNDNTNTLTITPSGTQTQGWIKESGAKE